MAAATFLQSSLSPPFLSSSIIFRPNHQISSSSCKFFPSTSSPPELIASRRPPAEGSSTQHPTSAAPGDRKRWKLSAFRGNFFLLDTAPVEESAQEIVTASDDGVNSIISVLLLIAFLGLSILTIGVIYIAVTDFLQKREKEKFEKDEEAKRKKSGKKGKNRSRARTGPRGFGQKIEEEFDDTTD